MGSDTKIEWTDATWNPITGCSKISPGCDHCYAERMAGRLAGRCGYDAERPFKVTLHRDKLEEPMRWNKPRMVFVVSMGDLFHADVDEEWIASVYNTMRRCQNHTFQILTKRPARALDVLMRLRYDSRANRSYVAESADDKGYRLAGGRGCTGLTNVWVGVTAEDQQRADERIPILLQIPAAKRFVSIEPMLGPVDVREYLGLRSSPCESCGSTVEEIVNARRGLKYVRELESMTADEVLAAEESIRRHSSMCRKCGERFHSQKFIDWVICGGETGPGARPMEVDWARSLRDQCVEAGVPFFFKGWSRTSGTPDRVLDGAEWDEVPK